MIFNDVIKIIVAKRNIKLTNFLNNNVLWNIEVLMVPPITSDGTALWTFKNIYYQTIEMLAMW